EARGSRSWPVSPQAGDPVEPEGKADAGNGRLRAEQRQEPVVAAAADERLARAPGRNLENEAGIIVERPAEPRIVGRRAGVDAVAGDRLGARGKRVERLVEQDAGLCGKAGEPVGGLAQRRLDGEEFAERR